MFVFIVLLGQILYLKGFKNPKISRGICWGFAFAVAYLLRPDGAFFYRCAWVAIHHTPTEDNTPQATGGDRRWSGLRNPCGNPLSLETSLLWRLVPKHLPCQDRVYQRVVFPHELEGLSQGDLKRKGLELFEILTGSKG